MAQKGSSETIMLMYPGTTHSIEEIKAFEYSRFDPANWKNSNLFVQAMQATIVWQQQADLLTEMTKESTLTDGDYFLLFNLLVVLCSSSDTHQQLALKIINTTTTSVEYPNDTFLNQLIYFILMTFADPAGDHHFDHDDLANLLKTFNGYNTGNGLAAQAAKKSLTKSLNILHSDASYPMNDPYNPNIGFNTRVSDTLSALDSARGGMK